MESALAWIGQIASWIGQWIPRWIIVPVTRGAVKYVGGKRIVGMPAGVHFYWPVTTVIDDYPIVRQTDRLETQTMETSDGKTFIASGTLTYLVEDVLLLLPRTYNAKTTIVDIAMAALHDECCDLDWETLQREQRRGTLKTKLKNSAQSQLAEYGIRVVKFQLNTLAKARVLKISQSVSNEEN